HRRRVVVPVPFGVALARAHNVVEPPVALAQLLELRLLLGHEGILPARGPFDTVTAPAAGNPPDRRRPRASPPPPRAPVRRPPRGPGRARPGRRGNRAPARRAAP